MIQHRAGIQNLTLARAYRITVEESRIGGKIAELHVRLNQTAYRLTFHEQKDGCWKLLEFDKREAFSQQAVKAMKDHPSLHHREAVTARHHTLLDEGLTSP